MLKYDLSHDSFCHLPSAFLGLRGVGVNAKGRRWSFRKIWMNNIHLSPTMLRSVTGLTVSIPTYACR